ncbi:MAG: M56 family metallopeptidase [Tannerella sp.]|jgi:TonB family protein|nr:M56 family metallopeptidase [Tannerella sp.]
MGDFFVYSLKSSLCLAAFYLFYKLLLSRDTFHRFNRIALLGIMGLSVIIPFITVISLPFNPLETTFEISPEQLSIPDPAPYTVSEISSPNRLLLAILLIYMTGCGVFLIRSLWTLFRILRLIRKGERTRVDNSVCLTMHSNHRIAPFSWMKNIVISRTDMSEAGDTILLHEQAHIRQHHTYDLILAEVCILFQWYNPAAWLLYRELQHIHEFEADQSVLNQGINAKQYQLLIIKKAVGTRLYSMANSFDHSNLKKRITMMLQKKSNPWARLKYAYVLPLAAISVIVFARPEISKPLDEISNAKVSHLIWKTGLLEEEIISSEAVPETAIAPPAVSQAADTTEIFSVVEERPVFPESNPLTFLSNNLNYPEKAKAAGISGTVVVQFVINRDGSISDVKVIRNADPELDAEAVRVVRLMPKWIPGKQTGVTVRVQYTRPVRFRVN